MKKEDVDWLLALTDRAVAEVQRFAGTVLAEASDKSQAIRRFEAYIEEHLGKMALEKGAEHAAIVIEASAVLAMLRASGEREH